MEPRIYWQIHRIAFLFEKKADENLHKQLNIGFAQYKVLEAINHSPLTKQNAVAKMLDQTEASISRQIRILQAKGMINATDVMGNKRARELSLTTVGEETVSQAQDILDVTQAEIMGELSYQEERLFQELFARMLEQMRKSD